MWQTYYTPRSLEGALQLLEEHKGNGRIAAGGTDLIVELKRGITRPDIVVDITRIPDLDRISKDEDDCIHLGPLVTHNQVVASRMCREEAFPLYRACWGVGSPQIRNRATVAGNLATASPANDTITPLWAMGASLTLQSVRGTRVLSMQDFYLGVRRTVLEPDELIVDISFPALGENEAGTFIKQGLRRAQAISVVNAAVILGFDGDEVSSARIALGSVAPTIIRAAGAEKFLRGKLLTEKVVAHAGQMAAEAAQPISDVRGSAEYRKYIAGVLTRGALKELAERTEQETVPENPVLLWGRSRGRSAARTGGKTLVHSRSGEEPVELRVNDVKYSVSGANHKTLLRMLREDIGLTGSKEGCAEGECGSCTVWMDGMAVLSCMVPAPQAHGSEIVTIEGLASGDQLHPLQEAFIDGGAVQCGYCIPGFIMSGAALLEEKENPAREEIKHALSGNLCRCTGYDPIIHAVQKAAAKERSGT